MTQLFIQQQKKNFYEIELMINKLHGLSPSGGLVPPSGGFASLFFDQVEYFASIKLCQALSRQVAKIKIPVVRCHYLLCSSAQYPPSRFLRLLRVHINLLSLKSKKKLWNSFLILVRPNCLSLSELKKDKNLNSSDFNFSSMY